MTCGSCRNVVRSKRCVLCGNSLLHHLRTDYRMPPQSFLHQIEISALANPDCHHLQALQVAVNPSIHKDLQTDSRRLCTKSTKSPQPHHSPQRLCLEEHKVGRLTRGWLAVLSTSLSQAFQKGHPRSLVRRIAARP